MLLHKQKSLYHLSDDEKSDLMDMILVAINEVTKFNPNESDGSRYDYGIDFSNMPPINPYVVSNVLQDLGYEEGDVDTNGWENDYWQSFTHPDEKKFPPMQAAQVGFMNVTYTEKKTRMLYISTLKMMRNMQIESNMAWS